MTSVSVVVPVRDQADHIANVVGEYAAALARIPLGYEIVLVPNASRDGSERICAEIALREPRVRSVPLAEAGWGRAVRHGLSVARGDLLCYTNSARTTGAELALAVLYASTFPGTVVKANRRLRERWVRRLGSLLYNVECRVLFDLSCWDVNGTPKVFPRTCTRLLELTRNDDLIDLEFVTICREAGYPMLEIPIFSHWRHGGRSTTTVRSAIRLYWGAWALRCQRGRA
jgi:glycosyltransferase involved in cell wall biosynthesis